MMIRALKRFYDGQEGAIAIEYTLIAAAVALGIIVFLTSMGQTTKRPFEKLAPVFAQTP